MEGLIPFLYNAIVQSRTGNYGGALGASWLAESPSASYMRLPGDSGRFQIEVPLIRPDLGSTSTSTAVQSPIRRSASRRTVSGH
ncbi:hypothetical protein EJ110_NYTH48379 [Nymphaea thermarum]|nr:hypothetical protein EJ110_NYTH48379 [Nymphaea thermarum]